MNEDGDSGFIKVKGHKHLSDIIKDIINNYWDETR